MRFVSSPSARAVAISCTLGAFTLGLTGLFACSAVRRPNAVRPELVGKVPIPWLQSSPDHPSCAVTNLIEAHDGTQLLETELCGVFIRPLKEREFFPLERNAGHGNALCMGALRKDGRFAAAYENNRSIKMFRLEDQSVQLALSTDFRWTGGCGTREGHPHLWFSGTRLVVEFGNGNLVVLDPETGKAFERIAGELGKTAEIASTVLPGGYPPEAVAHKEIVTSIGDASLNQSMLERREQLPGMSTPPIPEIRSFNLFADTLLLAGSGGLLIHSDSFASRFLLAPHGTAWVVRLSDGQGEAGMRDIVLRPGDRDAFLESGLSLEPGQGAQTPGAWPNSVNTGIVSEDGRVVYLAHGRSGGCEAGPSADHEVSIVMDTVSKRHMLKLTDCEAGATLSPDGRRFACVRRSGGRRPPEPAGDTPSECATASGFELAVYDTQRSALLFTLPVPSLPFHRSIFFSSNGEKVYTAFEDSSGYQRELLQWDISKVRPR